MKAWLWYFWFRLRGHKLEWQRGSWFELGIKYYKCRCGGFMELHFNLFTMAEPIVMKATCPYAVFVKSMQLPSMVVKKAPPLPRASSRQ